MQESTASIPSTILHHYRPNDTLRQFPIQADTQSLISLSSQPHRAPHTNLQSRPSPIQNGTLPPCHPPRPLTPPQAPRTLPPAKLAACASWLRRSGTCHTARDLERALPGAAGVHAAAAKDYVQALVDDGLATAERIGAANWFWSFASEERVRREGVRERVGEERGRLAAVVEGLRGEVEELERKRGEEDGGMGAGCEREALVERQAALNVELEGLRAELAAYSEHDPVEMEKRKGLALQKRIEAEAATEKILCVEAWFKKQVGGDKSLLLTMRQMWYGEEFDEEDLGLREL